MADAERQPRPPSGFLPPGWADSLARLDEELKTVAHAYQPPDLRDVVTARINDARDVASVTVDHLPGLDPSRVQVHRTTARHPITGHPVQLRVYEPDTGVRPGTGCLVFLHGGAFCLGDLETDHLRLLLYVQETSIVAVSVDYRLAPENPFPAGLDDCRAALSWVRAHADDLGVPPSRIGVGGESAGAGLAAALALSDRDSQHPPLMCQLLLFPAVDNRLVSASVREFARAPAWDGIQTALMWQHYLPAGVAADWAAAPALADDLSGLPPTLVVTAGVDPLRDEGIDYGRRLIEAGVAAETHHYPDGFHVFDLAAPAARVSQRALREQMDFLARHLGPTEPTRPC